VPPTHEALLAGHSDGDAVRHAIPLIGATQVGIGLGATAENNGICTVSTSIPFGCSG
jgi:2C-methyl-D-erythritol 2,4-cyclodiphosphate synthase